MDSDNLAELAFTTLRLACVSAPKASDRIAAAKTILDFTKPKQRSISFENSRPITINFISPLAQAKQIKEGKVIESVPLALPSGTDESLRIE